MKRYKERKPQIHIEIITEHSYIDASPHVLRCQTIKDISGAPGVFNMTLVSGNPFKYRYEGETKFYEYRGKINESYYYRQVKPMSIVRIKFDNNPNWNFIGLVDRVGETVSVMGNRPRRAIQVQGRDFTKLFLKHKIFYNRYVKSEGLVKYYEFFENAKELEGTPREIVGKIIEIFLDRSQKPKMINDYPLEDYLDLENFLDKTEYQSWIKLNYIELYRRFWDMILQFANRPFNEIFIDTFPTRTENGNNTRSHLVLRKTPFDDADWNNLKAREYEALRAEDSDKMSGGDVILRDDDIVDFNLSRSDYEVYNYYFVYPIQYPMGKIDIKVELGLNIDVESQRLYGLNLMEESTPYCIKKDKKGNIIPDKELAKVYSDRLRKWYEKNPEFESGYFLVKGNSLYHVGDPMYRESTGMRYYVERVIQNYIYGGRRTTRLEVTRGYPR